MWSTSWKTAIRIVMVMSLLGTGSFAFCRLAAQEQDALKKELSLLEGEWSMIAGEIAAQKMPEEFLKSAKRVAKGNETTVTMAGQIYLKATITIDPSKNQRPLIT